MQETYKGMSAKELVKEYLFQKELLERLEGLGTDSEERNSILCDMRKIEKCLKEQNIKFERKCSR